MNDTIAIKAENISKKYCKSLKKSMLYGLKDIIRNTIGLSSHSDRLRKDEFWAVNDVSFEVKKGETLGIVGPNGSGKTTILKMLNGIFWPDKGKITVRGKIGALIEVGAGFHPMLTGRENVYINGAILGMNKAEINEKFDDIVKFADIGDFFDVPVKFYSSGMFIRLGFAVAIHCEPDILLVDEVLAVGDSAFRNKCHQKMNEIKKKRDLAIVIVSHNLLTVERFCDQGLFLNYGVVKNQGEIHEIIRDYQSMIYQSTDNQDVYNIMPEMPHSTKDVEILEVLYLDPAGNEKNEFSLGDTLGIRVKYNAKENIPNPIFEINLFNREGVHIAVFGTHLDQFPIKSVQGKGIIECWTDNLPLLMNKYYATVVIFDETNNVRLDYWDGTIYGQFFRVLPNKTSLKLAQYTPIIQLSSEWKMNEDRTNTHQITE